MINRKLSIIIMLLVVAIFMMITPVIEQGVEADLPTEDVKMVDMAEQQPTIITINKDGKYFINSLDKDDSYISKGGKLPLGIIAGRVSARLDIYPNMRVFVRGDKDVAYGAIMSLTSFLQRHGINKIGIVVDELTEIKKEKHLAALKRTEKRLKKLKAKVKKLKMGKTPQSSQDADYGFIVIDSSAADASIREYPGSFKDYKRVPMGTKLEVLDKAVTGVTKYMPSGITWYKIKYNGTLGWVSEFVTNSADLHN